MDRTHYVEHGKCPKCERNIDGATGLVEGTPGPEEGDLSICAYCLTMLVFNEDLSSRVLGPEEFLELPTDARLQLSAAMAALVLDLSIRMRRADG